MARKGSSQTVGPEHPHLRMPVEQAHQEIGERIALGKELRAREITDLAQLRQATEDRYTWDEFNDTLLSGMFDNDSIASEYRGFYFGGPDHNDLTGGRRYFQEEMDRSLRKLESIQQRLKLYDAPKATAPGVRDNQSKRTLGRDVFIVHGHDEGRKETMARFIGSITKSEPKILHELPNQGQTIIEKLENCAKDVGFAVVILTPDDVGSSKVQFDDNGEKALKPRARQNVVLELGYFVGLLGRSRVCALNTPEIELPSDYAGVLFVPLDPNGGWRLKLAQELRGAGYDIDTAALLRA